MAAVDEAGAVSRLHDVLSLHEGQIVVVVRLERAPHYNYAPGVVVRRVDDDGRLGVELLHSGRQTLSIRRSNLLRADHEEDRAAILTQAVWERQLELRVARNFLLDRLRGEEGLALHIASFFPARQTMALTTGFAMGRIVPTWSCATLSTAGRLHWRPIHEQRDGRQAVFGASHVRDGLVRIDCAVVDIGSGRFVVAGGCDDHPSRARTFFKSAFIYDALTHAATPLPDMPCARHGCGGALVDGKVYVVGGGYADMRGAGTVCSVLDLATHTWAPLPSAEFDEETLARLSRQLELEEMLVDEVLRRSRIKAHLAAMHKLQVLQRPIAFVPVGSVEGRLVCFVGGLMLVFNPADPEAGWQLGTNYEASHALSLGFNAQACTEWAGHLIISAGRGSGAGGGSTGGQSNGCGVAAFTFVEQCPDQEEPWRRDYRRCARDQAPSSRRPEVGPEVGEDVLKAMLEVQAAMEVVAVVAEDEHDTPREHAITEDALHTALSAFRPSWACGRWKYLGEASASARVGAGLAVIHDQLFISGGVDEDTGFDGTIARWTGTVEDLLVSVPGGGAKRRVRLDAKLDDIKKLDSDDEDFPTGMYGSTAIEKCVRPWVAVSGLELPTAMHAHSAIAVPWLPSMLMGAVSGVESCE